MKWLLALVCVFALLAIGRLLLSLMPADAPVPPDASRVESRPSPAASLAPAVVRPPAGSGMVARVATPRPAPVSAGATPVSVRPGPGEIPGEQVLTFYSESDRERFLRSAEQAGVRVLDRSRIGYAVRIRTDDAEVLRRAFEGGAYPIEQAPNYRVRLPDPPPQPAVPESGTPAAFGDAALAWLGASGNADWGGGVLVAVLDTAIGSHPSLDGVSIERVSMLAEGSGGAGDAAGHGTAVASLIAGRGAGVTGVAPAVRLLSVEVLGADGAGDAFTLANGIVAAVDRGARVLNISLGSDYDSPILRDAVRYAQEKGAVLVAAVGNGGIDRVQYPARYEGVLAVAAVDAAGRPMSFSNRGPDVTLAAPGVGVQSAWEKESVVLFSGTSAATPFVAGASAYLLGSAPDMDAGEVRDALRVYATDTGEPGPDERTGFGVLDLQRLAQRNTPGICDISLGLPYVTVEGEMLRVHVFAQNRGTERLPVVALEIQVENARYSPVYYDVKVGQSVGDVYTVDARTVRNAGQVSITYGAVARGVEDSYPRNNAPRTLVLTY